MTKRDRPAAIADRILKHCTQVLTIRSVPPQVARDIADQLYAKAKAVDMGIKAAQLSKMPVDLNAPSAMVELPAAFSDAIPPLEVLRTIIERQLTQEFLSEPDR